MRLIDADALKTELRTIASGTLYVDYACHIIDHYIPTINAVAIPCKVGDEIFSRRWSIKNEKYEVRSGKVRTVRYDAAENNFMVSDGEMFGLLGRDVFLTPESAENALKGEK